MKNFLPILLFFILMTMGCYSIETVESTKISAGDVYQSYLIRASKNLTSVSATFRGGGNSGATIDLDAPSKIEHNGNLMPEIAPTAWKGTTYEDSVNKFIGQQQFIYTDAGGKTFRNEVNIEPLEFGGNSFKVSRSNKVLIPLSRIVGKTEEISAYISGRAKPAKSNESSNDSASVRLDAARSAVVIEPDDLKNLLNGKTSLKLTVEKTELLKQTSAKGGAINVLYKAQEIALNIIK